MYLNLRTERIKKGWTQEQVAKRINTTLSAVQKIETGQRAPSYKVLCKLEKLFGKPHNYLLTQIGTKEE